MTEEQYYGLSGRPKNLEEQKLEEIKAYLGLELNFAENRIIEVEGRENEAYWEGYSRALINLCRHFFKEVR